MIQICVLAIAGLFAALIIKKDKPEFAVLIIMLVSFFIAIRILTVLGNAVEELESWESILGGNIDYISLLLKIIGITYVCDFAANLCKDSGYAASESAFPYDAGGSAGGSNYPKPDPLCGGFKI